MIFSLFSCTVTNISKNDLDATKPTDENQTEQPTEAPTDASDEQIPAPFSSYDSILEFYDLIIDCLNTATTDPSIYDDIVNELLGGEGSAKKRLFDALCSSAFDFGSYPYDISLGYDEKDLNKDGTDELVLLSSDYAVVAIFSMSDGKPVLLGNYINRGSCWIDSDGLLHVNGSNGASNFCSTVYRIADGGASLEPIIEFGADGYEWVGEDAVTKYYKLIEGVKSEINETEFQSLCLQYVEYIGAGYGAERTMAESGLSFENISTPDAALSAYACALNSDIKVSSAYGDEQFFLMDYRFPYSQTPPLCELESLTHAYIDLDGDNVKELIINNGELLMLHYHKGKVYAYDLGFRIALNSDGSYSWNDSIAYGKSRMVFDGTELISEVIWKIVNDGTPEAEYYIGEEQVSCQEIQTYFEENPNTKLEFAPLEINWNNRISAEEAIELAEEFWEVKSGDIDETTGFPLLITLIDSNNQKHVIALEWLVEGSHYSTVEIIDVDAYTGEISIHEAKG